MTHVEVTLLELADEIERIERPRSDSPESSSGVLRSLADLTSALEREGIASSPVLAASASAVGSGRWTMNSAPAWGPSQRTSTWPP